MELRPYQVEARDFLSAGGGGIYADAPGSGKTATTLRWLEHDGPPVSLIVAPNGVAGQWVEAAQTWAPSLTVIDGRGDPAKRAKAYDEVVYDGGALVVNYESARADIKAGNIRPGAFDAVVADEAHYLKNHSSLTFRQLAKVARKADGVALLTGTPLLNHPEELWPLLHMLRPREYRSYWAWVYDHFEVETTTFYGKLDRAAQIIGEPLEGALAAIRDEVAPYLMMRGLETLVGELPPLEHHEVPVVLSDEERRLYDDFERRMWMKVGGKLIVAPNEVSKLVRLRQLASDWSQFQTEEQIGSKVATARDLIMEKHGQKVVFVQYKDTARALQAQLPVSTAVYHGDLTASERKATLRRFKAGDLDAIIGTFGVMAEGLDGLQCAEHAILVDHDWTPSRNEQAIARVWRQGQLKPVHAWHVTAQGTIDESVTRSCETKSNIIDKVLN